MVTSQKVLDNKRPRKREPTSNSSFECMQVREIYFQHSKYEKKEGDMPRNMLLPRPMIMTPKTRAARRTPLGSEGPAKSSSMLSGTAPNAMPPQLHM